MKFSELTKIITEESKNAENEFEFRTALKQYDDLQEDDEDEDMEEGEDSEEDEEDDDYILTLDFQDHFVHDILNRKFSLSHFKELYLDSLQLVNSQCRNFLKSGITTVDELYFNK
mmetsp:Transcript_7326/g.6481  ORF Transcript_7326/g.6481 Transcript_7326/m.6481 type:complete len:115 (+) Transcript_7326:158-502(+)